MQKKLIALAVAGLASGAAFAQSNVTMYGIVDAGIANVSASGRQGDTLMVSGGLSTSRLGVKGVEDLGNGLKVVANLEYGLDVGTSDTIGAARQEMLALAGGFGTVAAGYLQTAAYDFGVKYDVTAGSAVSPLQNITNTTAGQGFLIGSSAGATRAQRALAYISPNMNGFTLAVNYSTALAGLGNAANASGTDNATTATLLAANYDNGPLSVGFVNAKTSTGAQGVQTGDRSEWALGGSYNLGVATVKGTYQRGSNVGSAAVANSNATDKVWSLGAVIPAGPGAVVASYAKSSIATTAERDVSGYTLGYLYSLSKRSTVYAAYNKLNNSGTSTNGGTVGALNGVMTPATQGGSASVLAVGLKHTF